MVPLQVFTALAGVSSACPRIGATEGICINCPLKDRRNQFECSILYRLLLSMGAHYLVIEPLSQGDRAFNSTYPPEPIRVPLPSPPKLVGRKDPPCNYLQSCKENRLLGCCREPSSDLHHQRPSPSPVPA